MSKGLVFDIKEFALHDGKGLRTTVFLKGCPLRCEWCHNPEGQGCSPELIKDIRKCYHCGECEKPCGHEECAPFGICIKRCPENCLSVCGRYYSPGELAGRIAEGNDFLRYGGVTFSGGEPLCQFDFIRETVGLMGGINTAVETCGCVPQSVFAEAVGLIDDFYFDIKLIGSEDHRRYTGADNALILRNAEYLFSKKENTTVRIPLIPGVTDTNDNLKGISDFLAPYKDKVRVEMLPYNRLTGAKYRKVGKEYRPSFDEDAKPDKAVGLFEKNGINAVAY